MSATYRINSTPMVYVPGIVNWARHTESPKHTLAMCLPDLPDAAIEKLVAGEYNIDGEDVLVEVPGCGGQNTTIDKTKGNQMQKADLTDPPKLDIDTAQTPQYELTPYGVAERKIVWNLCAHLKNNGFEIVGVDDGEGYTDVHDAKSAMELIFNLDEAWLRARKAGFSSHPIALIMGNGNGGRDLIADYSYSEGDPDGFEKAMEAFDTDTLFG